MAVPVDKNNESVTPFPGGSPPLVWMLLGKKAGDNEQVEALAGALGWESEAICLDFRSYELLTNLMFRSTLAGVATSAQARLRAPWPDLVITAGRRNEPVARWIQTVAGKTVRLVHLGRPWADPSRFDLVISNSQYNVPAAPNVVQNILPLHAVNAQKLETAAQTWTSRFSHLAEPRFAMLVGGNSGAYTFTPGRARVLGEMACQMVATHGGSLLVSTSARTPRAAADLLEATLSVPHLFYRWGSSDNPYAGYLAVADAFIVTGDSVSMLAEACATGKPVYIFPAAQGKCSFQGSVVDGWSGLRFNAIVSMIANALAPPRMARDVGAVHRRLIEAGKAAWLGQEILNASGDYAIDDLSCAVSRVRKLFAT